MIIFIIENDYVIGVMDQVQLNIALILLSNVWSSKLSIFIAWKYSFGSKYPFAIKKVCLSTIYLILASS